MANFFSRAITRLSGGKADPVTSFNPVDFFNAARLAPNEFSAMLLKSNLHNLSVSDLRAAFLPKAGEEKFIPNLPNPESPEGLAELVVFRDVLGLFRAVGVLTVCKFPSWPYVNETFASNYLAVTQKAVAINRNAKMLPGLQDVLPRDFAKLINALVELHPKAQHDNLMELHREFQGICLPLYNNVLPEVMETFQKRWNKPAAPMVPDRRSGSSNGSGAKELGRLEAH